MTCHFLGRGTRFQPAAAVTRMVKQSFFLLIASPSSRKKGIFCWHSELYSDISFTSEHYFALDMFLRYKIRVRY